MDRKGSLQKKRSRTVSLTVCALLSALCVVLLLLGCVIDTIDLSMAALCCVVVWLVLWEYGVGYALMQYFVVSLLSLLLLPVKAPGLLFAGITGWYPIAKFYFDKLPKPLSLLCKLLSANAAAALLFFGFRELLGFQYESKGMLLLCLLLFNIALLLMDILLRRIVPFYLIKIRPHLPKAALRKK